MGDVLRVPDGRAILLTPRSGSHSIAATALKTYWPDQYALWEAEPQHSHPAVFTPEYEAYCGQTDLAIVVRNPVERFRSMIAHRQLGVAAQLENPIYPPLPKGSFVKYFKFETQLDECAAWLGLATPLPQIDATDERDKPILTPEQEARVREIYADDITLWESL